MILKLVAVALVVVSCGMSETTVSPVAPDFDRLFDRVVGSEFVLRGRLASTKSIAARKESDEAILGKYREGKLNLADLKFGTLFIVDVVETVCRQSDFRPVPGSDPLPGQQVLIFVPQDEPIFSPRVSDPKKMSRKERLLPQKEYLLFVKRDPREVEIKSQFELDSEAAYYRAFDGVRGVVEFPSPQKKGSPGDFATPLIDAVSSLCEAVRPEDVQMKLSRLTGLRYLAAPAWRDSVDAAIRTLRGEQNR